MSRRSRFSVHALAAAVVSFGVTACGILNLDQNQAPTPRPPTPRPDAPAAPAAAETPRAPRTATATPPRPATLPSGQQTTPDVKVVGLNQAETEALLGQPTSSIDRPPAKVWQYRTRECAVDIYFYLDVGRNDFYALHYDTPAPTSSTASASATAVAPDAADRCLRRLYNARRQR
jgi:hypothetical protein